MEPNNFLTQIISQFANWYKPAQTIDQATDFFSTAEIVEALQQFNPGAQIDNKLIFDALTEAGYSYAPNPQQMAFQLKWMLTREF